ncbi:MAG: hypothetical protein KKG09_01750 [Verrucomicrobia bacterium]|nr:hypothetical protein [Verrucomicrobiota bacterium]MCG2680584.1 hypothetical protein [Kiritimatiellia bacterium]MBU4247524.1 hypothetical protein [Verrucomicrobiota bacterium]MBU4290298.1 hypothetical protein [Verrucomicrobiota bacterium]MBU4429476.1 hypothetical protein [Verrucomicrobiota bacterium]
MSSVSEWIVREYFEMQGYLVSQPCKYAPGGRRKRLEEEIDLVVVNPLIGEQRFPDSMIWTTADLKSIPRAVVGIHGWHTERFYPTLLDHIPEMLRFASEESIRLVSRRMGAAPIAKILCFPQLPASEKLRTDTLKLLKQKGIDGVLLFRTLLVELVNGVDINKNYEKSDLLQMLRILKNYDLIRQPQMELFGSHKRRRPKDKAPPTEPASSSSGPV